MGAAAADRLAPDRPAAAGARLPGPAVDPVLVLKRAGFAVRAAIIADGRSSRGQSPAENPAHRGPELSGSRAGQPGSRGAGMNARIEQHFVGIDIPDPGHKRLIQKDAFHPPLPAAEAGGELAKGNFHGLGTQAGQFGATGQLRGRHAAEESKLAGVLETELGAGAEEAEDETDVLPQGRAGPGPEKPPGHAEVEDENAVIANEEQMLSPAADGRYRFPAKASQGGRVAAEKLRPEELRPGDGQAEGPPAQAGGDGFDFGQLRHAPILLSRAENT